MKTSCCHTKSVRREKDLELCMNQNCENYMLPTSAYVNRTWNNIFALFFFIFFFILSFDDFCSNGNGVPAKAIYSLMQQEIAPLTPENLKKELEKNNILCQEEVFAQIMIESGYLSSYLTRHTNNLLGMRYPFRRTTEAIGLYLPASKEIVNGNQSELKKFRTQNHYAVFATWQDCIKDYKHWQDESFKLKDRYLTFLGMYYAEDTLYVQKIRKLASK
jgi:hypothetical protein